MQAERQNRRDNNPNDPVNLNRYLAQCGVASRRKCDAVIREGRVRINDVVVTQPGMKVTPDDRVQVDGTPVSLAQLCYIMLNKPVGYTCTNSDVHAEKTVFDLVGIPGVRLFSIGRLDKDSEGLLLLTNDGEYANRITHPRYNIKKTYQVTVDSCFTDDELAEMVRGIEDQGEVLRAVSVSLLDAGTVYQFVMGEGRKREIRRLVSRCGKKTIRLKRVAIGGLRLNKLSVGHWRYLSEEERVLSMRP